MEHHKFIIDSCVDAAFDMELYTGPDTFEDRVLDAMIRWSRSFLAQDTDAAERVESSWLGGRP